MPERIQRRRTKGWRMPESTVYVGRGTKWGNPYRVTIKRDGVGDEMASVFIPEASRKLHFFWSPGEEPARKRAAQVAVENYDRWIRLADLNSVRAELAGKNLACWCPVDQPCHADVLLEIANAPAGDV